MSSIVNTENKIQAIIQLCYEDNVNILNECDTIEENQKQIIKIGILQFNKYTLNNEIK
jgi:hypothetical protein